jgi:hypothetical protein
MVIIKEIMGLEIFILLISRILCGVYCYNVGKLIHNCLIIFFLFFRRDALIEIKYRNVVLAESLKGGLLGFWDLIV